MTTGTLRAQDPRASANALLAALVVVAIIGIAFATVQQPFLAAGAVLGVVVLAVALLAPLALVAVMLVIGAANLSFATGGFKSLFPQFGGLDMNGIRLLAATAGFLAYVMFAPRSRQAAFGPLGRLWVLFLFYAGLTMAISLEPFGGLRLLLKLAYPFLTFLIVVGLANSRERLELLTRYTLLAAAFFAVVLNPLLALRGGYRIDATGLIRVGGLGAGDNPFAFYVMVMLFIAFARFLLRMQLRYLLFSILMVVWVWLTVTRIAALASVVGLGTIAALMAVTSGNRKVLIGSALAVVTVGVLLLPNVLERSLGFVPGPAELVQLVRNPAVMYHAINWQGRELLWAILWVAIMASPVIGHGLGSSAVFIRESFPDQRVQVAHNEYLRLATDTGLIGVFLFAAACIGWLVAMLRLSLSGDRTVREFAFPAVAAILAWAVISITDNPLDYYGPFTQYVGFLVAGAVVAHEHRQDEPGVEAAD